MQASTPLEQAAHAWTNRSRVESLPVRVGAVELLCKLLDDDDSPVLAAPICANLDANDCDVQS